MAVTTTITEQIVRPQVGLVADVRQKGTAEQAAAGTGYQVVTMSGSDVGDATGGTMAQRFRVPLDQYYYTVVGLYASRGDSGVDTIVRYQITATDFEQLTPSSLAGNFSQNIGLVVGTIDITLRNAAVPFYLGRALVLDSSDVQLVFPANTDTIVYDFRLVFLRSLRPGIPAFNQIQQAVLL